jgi:50S ribosomal subunit-associated GTPase HflX
MVIARLRQREPHSVVVSARTGEGVAEALRVIEGELPRPGVEFKALLPYERGDLINRLHQHGEIDSMEHTGEGIDEALLAVEADLPRPDVAFEALLPYERGDLLNRIHEHGEVVRLEHTGEGTVVHGRVHGDLAGQLEPYLTAPVAEPART